MLDARPVRKTGCVITSDKRLVGFNSAILKAVLDMIKRDHDSEDEYAIIFYWWNRFRFLQGSLTWIFSYELRPWINLVLIQVGKIISKAVGIFKMNFLMNSMYYNHHVNSLSAWLLMEQISTYPWFGSQWIRRSCADQVWWTRSWHYFWINSSLQYAESYLQLLS